MTRSCPSPLAVLRNRRFALLWVGEFISLTGSGLTTLAASILVFRETGSALSIGLMMVAAALPSLCVGLIAGVVVDRYDRRRIMIVANLISAGLIALVPPLLPHGMGWLYLLVMLASAAGQFSSPALASVLPEIAAAEELAAANSLLAVSTIGSRSLGFAAAGFITARYAIEVAFYADALTFVVAALCVLPIRIAPLRVEGKTNLVTVYGNLRAGLRFVGDTAPLRSLFLLLPTVCFGIGLWNVLSLPFATRALQASGSQYAIFEGLYTVGFVASCLVMAAHADRLQAGNWIALSFLGLGWLGLVFGLSRSVPVAYGLFTVRGILNAPQYVTRNLLIQRTAPRELRGRVSSVFIVTSKVSLLAGMAAAGLADYVDVRVLVVSCGLLLVACGFVALLLPGLGRPAAGWRQTLAPVVGAGWSRVWGAVPSPGPRSATRPSGSAPEPLPQGEAGTRRAASTSLAM
jgi:MFS family permease